MIEWITGGIIYAVIAYFTYMFAAYSPRSDIYQRTLAPLLGPIWPVYYLAFALTVTFWFLAAIHAEFRKSIRGY